MKRLILILPLFLAVTVAALTAGMASGQINIPTCPDNYVLLWPAPYGFSPGGMTLCDTTPPGYASQWQLDYDPELPCEMGVRHNHPLMWLQDKVRLLIIPSANYQFPSGVAELQFYTYGWSYAAGNMSNVNVRIYTYDQFGAEIGFTGINANNYEHIVTAGPFVYDLFKVDNVLVYAETGGWFEIEIGSQPFVSGYTGIQSLAMADSNGTMPTMCFVAEMEPTPSATPTQEAGQMTPTPTITPTATLEPTATMIITGTATMTPVATSTPWPTSAGGTATVVATGTPQVYSPSQMDATPTRIPIGTMPPLVFPTLQGVDPAGWPTLAVGNPGGGTVAPNLTVDAYYVTVEERVAEVALVATQWATATNFVWIIEDIQSGQIISHPEQVAGVMVSQITAPVARVKGLSIYMPHSWPYLWFIFLMVLFVAMNVMVKSLSGILTSIIVGIIRNIWNILIILVLGIVLWIGLIGYLAWQGF